MNVQDYNIINSYFAFINFRVSTSIFIAITLYAAKHLYINTVLSHTIKLTLQDK